MEEDHSSRSTFIKNLVQGFYNSAEVSFTFSRPIPKTIIQFWDNLAQLPLDVHDCIETWKVTEQWGIKRLLFDKTQAREFIDQKLGSRYKLAFDRCYHPAMQSDYFRLCYIFSEGGCYIDTDDVYNGTQIQHLFSDGRLKIQPLCYDIPSHGMISPKVFTKYGANTDGWIFYFNNNPIFAKSGHPIIEHALGQATKFLEKANPNSFPEIQATAGPGNLTKSIFDTISTNSKMEETLYILNDWEDIATSKWELSYRNDLRNWRLSNGQDFYNSDLNLTN